MVAQAIDIVDSKFDKYQSLEYKLSILIGMDSFFYLIEDLLANVLVIKQIEYNVEEKMGASQKELVLQRILMQEKLLQLPYANVAICYSSPRFTLVPNELFYKHQLQDYLEQVTRIRKKEEVAMCPVKKLDATLIYGIDKIELDVAKSYFPGAKHLHIIAPLLLYARQYAKAQKGYQVFAHVGKGIVGVLLYKQDNLKLVNTYTYKTEKDFLYHVLKIYEQFDLDPELIPTVLSGRIQKKSELYDQLNTYVRHLNILQSPSYYQYGPAFQDVNFHFYMDLLSISLCE